MKQFELIFLIVSLITFPGCGKKTDQTNVAPVNDLTTEEQANDLTALEALGNIGLLEYVNILILENLILPKSSREPHQRKDDYVTAYARTDEEEDFAETFSVYVQSTVKLWAKAISHFRETGCPILLAKTLLVQSSFEEGNLLYVYTCRAAFKIPIELSKEAFRRTASLLGQGVSVSDIETNIEKTYAKYAFQDRSKYCNNK